MQRESRKSTSAKATKYFGHNQSHLIFSFTGYSVEQDGCQPNRWADSKPLYQGLTNIYICSTLLHLGFILVVSFAMSVSKFEEGRKAT